MTGPLLKVTSTPYQSVRFSQNARLVPSESLDLERRKAIARMRAFQSQNSSGTAGNIDIHYVRQINRTFSSQSAQQQSPVSPKVPDTAVESYASSPSTQPAAAPVVSANSEVAVPDAVSSTTVVSEASVSLQDTQAAISAENSSSYTMERGSFEFRVAKGDVSFMPSFVMTIMTQRPEVHFEYLGGHNYVPADSFDENGIMNLSV